MHTIYPANTRISFGQDEAEALVDLFLRITKKSKTEVSKLKAKLSYSHGKRETILELQDGINTEIQKWSEKITRLGAVPVSLWKVKIPGEGQHYYTWEYPHSRLYYWQG